MGCCGGTPAAGGEREFSPPGGPICTGRASSEGCWAEISNLPGCYLWNPGPREGFSANWSGECSDGFAEGLEEVSWSWNDGSSSETGRMASGTRASYVNGERQATWRFLCEGRESGFRREEDPYVNGERHGTWTEYYEGHSADLVRAVGLWVNGERHGTWVFHYGDGNQGGGPYVNGERHGTWIFFLPEGRDDNVAREVGPYVNDDEHGTWTGYDASGRVVGTMRFENGRRVGGSRSAVEAAAAATVTSLQVASPSCWPQLTLLGSIGAPAARRGQRSSRRRSRSTAHSLPQRQCNIVGRPRNGGVIKSEPAPVSRSLTRSGQRENGVRKTQQGGSPWCT